MELAQAEVGNATSRSAARSRTASRPRRTSGEPTSRITASGANTAATASGSWAFHAANVARLAWTICS
jgi:hypothetical protein